MVIHRELTKAYPDRYCLATSLNNLSSRLSEPDRTGEAAQVWDEAQHIRGD